MTRPINPPVHPGEILCEEFLVPLGMGAGALAKRIHVPGAASSVL
jgi:antitoxin HigA-1